MKNLISRMIQNYILEVFELLEMDILQKTSESILYMNKTIQLPTFDTQETSFENNPKEFLYVIPFFIV